MNIKLFVVSCSFILAGWLTVSFFHETIPYRYPAGSHVPTAAHEEIPIEMESALATNK